MAAGFVPGRSGFLTIHETVSPLSCNGMADRTTL
jgi:hypothetical protein